MPNATVVATAAAVAATSALLFTLWTKAQVLYGAGLKRLQNFRVTRVLQVTEREVCLLGFFANDAQQRPAVATIRATALDMSHMGDVLRTASLHPILINDIYSTFLADVSRAVKPFKVSFIFPATEAHILKHSEQQFRMVLETPEMYESVTKPFIDSIPAAKIEWVYNILDHKTESERIVTEDPDPKTGFILLPDFKWSDPTALESLYCLAIVQDRSIRSLRDLNGSHIELLENIRTKSLAALESQFGIDPTMLRVYVHYQPTYYHFHVHFSHLKLLDGVFVGKAVLLDEILSILRCQPDYYQKHATLPFVAGDKQHKELYHRFFPAADNNDQ